LSTNNYERPRKFSTVVKNFLESSSKFYTYSRNFSALEENSKKPELEIMDVAKSYFS
jgi:hypothetical protein